MNNVKREINKIISFIIALIMLRNKCNQEQDLFARKEIQNIFDRNKRKLK